MFGSFVHNVLRHCKAPRGLSEGRHLTQTPSTNRAEAAERVSFDSQRPFIFASSPCHKNLSVLSQWTARRHDTSREKCILNSGSCGIRPKVMGRRCKPFIKRGLVRVSIDIERKAATTCSDWCVCPNPNPNP